MSYLKAAIEKYAFKIILMMIAVLFVLIYQNEKVKPKSGVIIKEVVAHTSTETTKTRVVKEYIERKNGDKEKRIIIDGATNKTVTKVEERVVYNPKSTYSLGLSVGRKIDSDILTNNNIYEITVSRRVLDNLSITSGFNTNREIKIGISLDF